MLIEILDEFNQEVLFPEQLKYGSFIRLGKESKALVDLITEEKMHLNQPCGSKVNMRVSQATVELENVQVFYSIEQRVKDLCTIKRLEILNISPANPTT